jgi:KTSC domain
MAKKASDDKWAAARRFAKEQEGDPDRKAAQRGKLDDESYDEDKQQWGPWVELRSSRIASVRYDPQNRAMLVAWTDGGPSYLYSGVSPERYRQLVRSSSPGRSIAAFSDYRPASPRELDAPSSPR